MNRVSAARLLVLGALVFVGAAVPAAAEPVTTYTVTPLVSNVPGVAGAVDPNLVNPWGLAASGSSPWWVADNGTDVSTLYTGAGGILSLVVTVPGGPTGLVFNGSADFVVTNGVAFAPARFIWDTEAGTILGWSPAVSVTSAVTAVNRSSVGAIYKGLAIGPSRLYAADFRNARVDVFDGSFHLVTEPGAFVDPDLPAGYAPFGIQTIGGRVFVAYAKQDAAAEDEEAGHGLGFVDEYDLDGHLIARVASRGVLNAPWGLAVAPQGFGSFSGDLLVGNFGDGRISAFELGASGRFEYRGQLRETHGGPISIDGLWALEFGNDGAAGPKETLFFTAGPNDETDGLFGAIGAD